MPPGRATTTTILFTDLVDSTPVLQRRGDAAAQRVFDAHARLLRASVARHGGEEVKWTGDGFMVAFDSVSHALRCAVDMQQASRRRVSGERLRVRVGVNVGEALHHDESDFFGTTVVVASRLCARAEAGEILCSGVVRALIPLGDEFSFEECGAVELKGVAAPVTACQLLYAAPQPAALVEDAPFVGRSDEVARLRSKLEEAMRGAGGMAMIVGEPGIGKTRTAEEFCHEARSAGARVLWGRCYDGDWAPPFSPFLEAIKEHAAAVSADQLHADLRFAGGAVARLIPSVRERLPDLDDPPVLKPDEERYWLLESVSEFFASVAKRAPLVLVLDDLHWADTATIAMLQHVARAAPKCPMLIIGMYRDVELDRTHPLAGALADLRRNPGYERIVLKGLDEREVAEMLDVFAEQEVPQALISAISAETDGNPLFVRLVLLHLIEEGKLRSEGGRLAITVPIAEMGIPEGVREAIGRRLSRLSDACNEMLTLSSALTGGVSWEALKAIHADLPDVRLLELLEEALAAQLIVERGEGGPIAYDFTHALVRHTLYDEMSAPRRILAHRRIAEAIEALYSDDIDEHVAELAYHFGRAAAGGDIQKAFVYCGFAGVRSRALFAWEDAAAHYERGRQLLALMRPDEQLTFDGRTVPVAWWRCVVLTSIAEVSGVFQPRQALELAARAAAEAEALGAGELLARAACAYEDARRVAALAGDDVTPAAAEGQRLIRAALHALPEQDSIQRAITLAHLPWSPAWPDSEDERLAASEEAVAMARRLGGPLEGATIATLPKATLSAGDWGSEPYDPLALTLYAMRWASLLGLDNAHRRVAVDTELVALTTQDAISARMTRIIDMLEVGDVLPFDAELSACRERAERAKVSFHLWWTSLVASTRALMVGDSEASERLARQALVASRVVGQQNLAEFLVQTFEIRRQQGRLGEVEEAFRGSLAEYRDRIPAWRAGFAFLCAEIGKLDEARDELALLARNDFGGPLRDSPALSGMTLQALACDLLGDAGHAEKLYELMLPYSDLVGVLSPGVSCSGAVSRYLGVLAATMRCWDDAEPHFEHALEMNARIGSPPQVAYTQHDYAKMLLGRGASADAARAIALLDESLATATRLGMKALAERASALKARHLIR